MRARFTVIAAVAALSFVAIAAAAAAAEPVPSTVTLSWSDNEGSTDSFDGKVSSSDDRCKENRHVLLFRKKKGRDPRVEDTRSLTDGFIIIEIEDPGSGRYYLKVKPKEIGNIVCERVKTGALSVTDLRDV